MTNNCLVCLQPVEDGSDYHDKCAKALFGSKTPPLLDINIDQLPEMATSVIKKNQTIPGVQKKLSVSLEQLDGTGKLTIVGALDGNYILKPSTEQYPTLAEVEHVTMQLAKQAGIVVAENGLMRDLNNRLVYITKRFDRTHRGAKVAVEDCCQLANKLTRDKYRYSSEKLGKLIMQYSTFPGDSAIRYFDRLIFCYLVGNADMHLKNFSLVTQNPQHIELSPSYDLVSTRLLIPEHIDNEALALPVAGKKRSLTLKHFLQLGESLSIPTKVVNKRVEKMVKSVNKSEPMINQSYLPDEQKEALMALIIVRSAQLTG